MEISNLPYKEFEIAFVRKLSELQENIERWFNKAREAIQKQSELSKAEIIKWAK